MTRLLVLMAASGPDYPLRRLAEQSVLAARGRGHQVFLRQLDGPASHGRKLDYGKTLAPDYDIAVAMDSDCVVFPGWADWITRTLSESLIGACGAPAVNTSGLHPSMLAMRSALYVKAPSFEAAYGHDTAGQVCVWLERQGLYLQGARETRRDAADWHHYDAGGPELWWHLGSGTASAWPGLSRQVYRTVRGWAGSRPHAKLAALVWRRRRFLRAARRTLGGER